MKMKSVFSSNIDGKGRIVRGIGALALLVGGVFGFQVSAWLGCALLVSGLFVAFEAVFGWCGIRACGIKTKL